MSENTQEPKREFRGVWIPVEICQLVVEGEITAHQAFLAATIDSLVSEDRGCYASNEYLAQCTGSTAKAVSNAISHLKKKGLVWQTGFDGRTRYLETAWSRLMQGPRKVDAGPIKSGVWTNLSILLLIKQLIKQNIRARVSLSLHPPPAPPLPKAASRPPPQKRSPRIARRRVTRAWIRRRSWPTTSQWAGRSTERKW